MKNMIQVGISDMKIAKSPEKIITYALGSCIGICLYDEVLRIGAMIHIMLPMCIKRPADNVYKYADTAIEKTLENMISSGSIKRNIKAKIAGGAKMFETTLNTTLGNVGERNEKAVRAVLKHYNIPIKASDVGLNYGRTMLFDLQNGRVTIKSYGKPDVIM